MKLPISAFLGVLLLTACGSSGPRASDVRPDWIDNPGEGVSASAGVHIRGRVAQEELAIFRAREEFAKRQGVSIQSQQTLSTTVANGRSSTTGRQASQEQTKQSDVRVKVKAKWRDPLNDVLWVWVVPN